jgi:hypothetical protein
MSSQDDLVNAAKAGAQNIGQLVKAFGTYFPMNGTAGTFTCTAGASTIVAAPSVKATSWIFLQPTNAAAGTMTGSVRCPYIASRNPGVSFTVTAASSVAFGTETFSWLLINLV